MRPFSGARSVAASRPTSRNTSSGWGGRRRSAAEREVEALKAERGVEAQRVREAVGELADGSLVRRRSIRDNARISAGPTGAKARHPLDAPICRTFTGATGLEPATSGVTDRFAGRDDCRRWTRNLCIRAAFGLFAIRFRMVERSRFQTFAAPLLSGSDRQTRCGARFGSLLEHSRDRTSDRLHLLEKALLGAAVGLDLVEVLSVLAARQWARPVGMELVV